jgi:glycosyltransferase involved in cell wall biosynthesis
MRTLARPFRPHVERIPLGVDMGRFGPASDRDAPRSGPPWRLLHVGSINSVKDHATLLRAFRRVADEVPGVSLDLVGEDTLGGAVQRLASSVGLDGMVRFHGFLPTEAVAGLCREAHLFMLTSRHEAGPVAVLESAACCVPTVGTAVGHVSEWAPDLALSRPIGDADALAQAAVTLLRDPSRRHCMGESARAWVEHHDADWTAERFESLYRQVCRT